MQNEVKYYSVSQYNASIKRFLDSVDACQDVHIKGEISNFKGATRGHLYFTLKDDESRINAVMFNAASKLDFEPKDGDAVLVDGKISVYVQTGQYQVYIDKMTLDGQGDLLKRLEELKKELQAEGLFDESHKRELPKYPERIGVITAPNKAAKSDIISTIKRRYPICEVILFPAIVQGDLAKDSIVKMIEEANDPKYNIDTLIVGRGGGSIEDLWAFNEEIVARAIYNSRIPVISAVGHETDFTIADFVADKRAPTPTGAAEMSVPSMIELTNYINQLNIRSNEYINNLIKLLKQRLDKYKTSYVLSNPLAPFEVKTQMLDGLYDRLNRYIKDILLVKYKNTLELNINKLELLNPLNVLKKGYSISSIDNKPIKSIKDVKKDDNVTIKVIDGEIKTIVKEIN
ncbi:MAG: exodeoxyribonuclease VII large subunit [Bacilli bacterium]|nr:exodeoxyribonuclease VII large subunit [Bacilli bacterium]